LQDNILFTKEAGKARDTLLEIHENGGQAYLLMMLEKLAKNVFKIMIAMYLPPLALDSFRRF